MNQNDAFSLLEAQLAYGESDPAELPDDLDDLLHLRNFLTALVPAIYAVRNDADEKAAKLIGPGKSYEYGESIYRWGHGYDWKAIPDVTAAFVEKAAADDPSIVEVLFNMNDIRKTGVEKAATRMGLTPEAAVDTVLEKKWKKAPGLQVKPKEL